MQWESQGEEGIQVGQGPAQYGVLETEKGEKGFCTGEGMTAKMGGWLHKRDLYFS